MKLSSLPLRVPSCVIIACLFYQLGCASTKIVPVYQEDYDDISRNTVIYVYLTNGSFYELTQVTVDGGYLMGTVRYEERMVRIRLEEINYITAEAKTITAVGFLQGLLIATGALILIVLITCAIASDE